jgi:hypothetical protein
MGRFSAYLRYPALSIRLYADLPKELLFQRELLVARL